MPEVHPSQPSSTPATWFPSEPEAQTCRVSASPNAGTRPEPAVAALVGEHARSALSVHPVHVPNETTVSSVLRAAPECAAELDAVVLALVAGASAVLPAALGGLKIGIDLTVCLSERLEEHDVAEAATFCREIGGTPLGVVDSTLTCAVPEAP